MQLWWAKELFKLYSLLITNITTVCRWGSIIWKHHLFFCLLICSVLLEVLSGTNISSSSSLLIAGNSTVNITCSAATGKAESVDWLKDNKPLIPGDRVILSADKKTLTIVKVVREDAGDYKCQLKNKVNQDESTYKMVINCKYPREESFIVILYMWSARLLICCVVLNWIECSN